MEARPSATRGQKMSHKQRATSSPPATHAVLPKGGSASHLRCDPKKNARKAAGPHATATAVHGCSTPCVSQMCFRVSISVSLHVCPCLCVRDAASAARCGGRTVPVCVCVRRCRSCGENGWASTSSMALSSLLFVPLSLPPRHTRSEIRLCNCFKTPSEGSTSTAQGQGQAERGPILGAALQRRVPATIPTSQETRRRPDKRAPPRRSTNATVTNARPLLGIESTIYSRASRTASTPQPARRPRRGNGRLQSRTQTVRNAATSTRPREARMVECAGHRRQGRLVDIVMRLVVHLVFAQPSQKPSQPMRHFLS